MNEIHELLKRPFSTLPIEQKLQIKTLGRPTPHLVLTVKNRKFNSSMYNKYSWLCGCAEKNALFCFFCVLYGGEKSWTKDGYKDLVHIARSAKSHELSTIHKNNMFSYSLLGRQNIQTQLSTEYRKNLIKKNEEVAQNRYALTKIINCIRFCGAFELALRGHNEKEDSDNKGIFKELVNFSAELDHILRQHLQQSSVFKGTSKTIQNELLECMLKVFHEEVKKQIYAADYVAVIADETTDISCQFQLVVILRYIVHGTPIERFLTFANPDGHDANAISSCILREIEEFIGSDCNKLIAQSYDGAAVMSGSSNGVQVKVREKYPHAHFIHCYAHQANLILARAASIDKIVRIFFSDLTGLCAFFSQSPQRTKILDDVVKRRLPNATPTRWNFHSRSVMTVYELRSDLIEVMDIIQSDLKLETTVHQASGYRRQLSDKNFIYWLDFFYQIMPHVDIIFNQLQKRNTDAVKVKCDIKHFEKQILNIRNKISTDSDVQQDDIVDTNTAASSTKRRKLGQLQKNKRVAIEVCDTIIGQIKDRFTFTGHITAVNLFASQQFSKYSKTFPEEYLKTTVKCYPFLNVDELRTELAVIYQREELRNLSGIVPLLNIILEDNLQETFKETVKLLKLLITIPMSTTEAERRFSMLKRIKTFLRNTMSEDRLNALAVLSCEKVLINSIDNFNNRVIDIFANTKNRRMDFLPKHV